MKKIFKLKKWLTLEETARRLSSVAEEEISLGDVLRLALDGHLKISADFINPARGKVWEIVPMGLEQTLMSAQEGLPATQLFSLRLNEKEILQPSLVYGDQEPHIIQGVFDLTMWGAEKNDIEKIYQKLTDGPDVHLVNLEGPFLRGDDGQIYQLLNSFDHNEHSYGSIAHLQLLEDHIVAEGIEPDAAKAIRAWHKEQRIGFLERAKYIKKMDNYYPASGLPSDCRLVVRNEAILQLEKYLLAEEPAPASASLVKVEDPKSEWDIPSVIDHPSREECKDENHTQPENQGDKSSKILDKRELASMERLIFALAREAGFKLENFHSDEASIQALLARHGAKGPMGKGSVVKYLKAARVRVEGDKNDSRA